jgi:isopenicillin N synthase-like dioxygenase
MLESHYAKLQKLSEQIADAIELGLGMPANQLGLRCQPTSSEIRLNHYPSVSLKDLAEGNIKRTWPHTDFGIISLVFQDKIGGLEIEDRSASSPYQRSFAPIPPANQDGSEPVVVLVSDTLQRWTNDIISAGRHQVSVPPFMKKQTEGDCPERYSAIFFLKAARDASVAPFPQFVTEKRPAVYGEMSALQFQERGVGNLY